MQEEQVETDENENKTVQIVQTYTNVSHSFSVIRSISKFNRNII